MEVMSADSLAQDGGVASEQLSVDSPEERVACVGTPEGLNVVASQNGKNPPTPRQFS
jgi:hypothetical protein